MPLPPCRLSLSDFHATNSKESTYKLVIIIIIIIAAMVVGTIFASGFLITLKFSQEIVVLVQKRDITQRGPIQTDQSQIFLLYHNILLQLSSNQCVGRKEVY